MKIRTAIWCISALVLAGCESSERRDQATEPVSVKEMTVGAAISASDYNYSGTVEEDSDTPLSFSAGGTITSMRVKVGDRVSRGQLIACVDPSSVQNAHEMALATLKQAEDAYARMKQLHDKGSLPEIQWVEVQSKLQQAVAAEKIARKNLADCNLYAPAAGVVAEKMAEVGQIAAPGVPVVKLVTTQVLNVKVSVPEQEIASVRQQAQADILVPALGGKHFTGHVVERGVVADPLSRSYSVKIRIAGTDASLRSGMVAKVSMGAVRADSSIVIPTRLLQLADDNSYFVYVDRAGRAERRTVQTGEFAAAGVVIVSGLRNGDKVITEGQQKVSNGSKVKCKN